MELVSVVIPTRNRAEYLPGAVESALGQSHPRMEVVVVDDGSDDGTQGILEKMADHDSRLRVVRHEEGGGAPRARNAGAGLSSGSVLAFLDDDCVFHPRKIERQLQRLGAEGGAVYCQQMIQQVGGGWEVEGAPGANDRPLEGLLNIGTNALLLRKDLFQKAGGFDEEMPRLQDWEFLLRLSRVTSFEYVPEILVKGVMVSGGITLTPGPLAAAAERIVEKHAPNLDPDLRSLLFYTLGKFLLVDGLTKEARRYMASALRIQPWYPRNWAGMTASLLGPGPARMVRGWRRDRRIGETVETWPLPDGVAPSHQEGGE